MSQVTEPILLDSTGQIIADKLQAIATAINGGTIDPLTITQNGTYTPSGSTLGYGPVTVNVGGGGVTILSGTGEPSAGQGSNGHLYLKYRDTTAPTGYSLLDYIYSDGYQYIDTGYVPTDTTEIEIVANIDVVNGTYSAICGTLGTPYVFLMTHINGSPNLTAGWGGSDTRSNAYNITGEVVTIKFSKGRAIVTLTSTGAEICDWSFTSGSTQISNSLYLLTAYGTTRDRAAAAKLYSAKIYEGGNIVHDYIPVQRISDNKPGLYDLETSSFLINSGTGEFSSSSVSVETILSAYAKVNGVWRPLIGTDIADINLGS